MLLNAGFLLQPLASSARGNYLNFLFGLSSSKFGVKSWPWGSHRETCHEFPRDLESDLQCETRDDSLQIQTIWPLRGVLGKVKYSFTSS